MIPSALHLDCFSAPDRSELIRQLSSGESSAASSGSEPCRMALLLSDRNRREVIDEAVHLLRTKEKSRFSKADRIFYSERLTSHTRIAWMIPGYGAHYPRMLAGLPEAFPAVAQWVRQQSARAQAFIQSSPWLLSTKNDPGSVPTAEQAYAILVADLLFSQALRSLEIPCDGVVGHSYGESAALHVTGRVDNPWKAIGLARRVFEAAKPLADPFAFLAVSADVGNGLDPSRFSVALDNCPSQCVVCGSVSDIAGLEAELSRGGELSFRLGELNQPVHTPFFSLDDGVLSEIYNSVEISEAGLPQYSCTTLAQLSAEPGQLRAELAGQWRETVRFRELVLKLHEEGFGVFLEVGPAGRLSGFVRDTLRGRNCTVVSCDWPDRDPGRQTLEALARIHLAGIPLPLAKIRDNCAVWEQEEGNPVEIEPGKPNTPGLAVVYTEIILREMATILDSESLPDPERGFFDSGLGSIQVIELAQRLTKALEVSIKPIQLFEHSTPAALALSLAGQPSRRSARKKAISSDEPIAVVGMACRIPGGALSPDRLWENLLAGVDAIGPVPEDRWDAGKLPGIPDWGGFLADIRSFDAGFFEISDREAATLDPQQRLLLELAWEAVEDARIDPGSLRGSSAGVFLGISGSEYAARLSPKQRIEAGGYIATGTLPSVAAGRLAHFLGVTGPAVALDTACSSSLVAIDAAVRSLQDGGCDKALAGGINVLLSPELTIHLAQSGALAPDGRCKAFDETANGYVRSEGGGLVLLKRLGDALAAGDPIHAVIRGTAVSHNGSSAGITVPSSLSQESLIRSALEAAHFEPDQIGALEAHGTGTKLGDPIELSALGSVFRGRTAPLPVSSIKSQVGHLEAGAGIAGLLKMVLQLKHRTLVRSLHFSKPNPEVIWTELPVRVVTENEEWPASKFPRIGGVSSFGISGTNAHVILEEPPASPHKPERKDGNQLSVYEVSAKSAEGLSASVTEHASFLDECEASAGDLSFSSMKTRANLPIRRVVAGRSSEEFARELRRPGLSPARKPGVVFLFPGQGVKLAGDWNRMAQDFPVFGEAFEQCRGSFAELGVRFHLDNPPEAEAVQAYLFTLEWSLYELWGSFGIKPSAVIGHSLGEITAATAAGILGLRDGIGIVAERSKLMHRVAEDSGMLSVSGAVDPIMALVSGENWPVDLAAINSPGHLVLSGDKKVLEECRIRLRKAGFPSIALPVARAFHSKWMAEPAEAMNRYCRGLEMREAQIPFFRMIDGKLVKHVEPGYWGDQMRQPVRFLDGIRAVLDAGLGETFLECGPGSTLSTFGIEIENEEAAWLSGISAGEAAPSAIANTLCRLRERGEWKDWSVTPFAEAGERVPLPLTQWSRKVYWIQSDWEKQSDQASQGGSSESSADPLAALVAKAHGVSGEEREKLVRYIIRLLCNGILGADPQRKFDSSRPFLTLGFDSMTATVLRMRIKKDFGVDPGVRWIIDEGNLNTLVERVLRDGEWNQTNLPHSTSDRSAAEKVGGALPLSVGQRALWFLWKLNPGSSAYHQTLPLEVSESPGVDWRALCHKLCLRHDLLHSRFPEVEGVPERRVQETHEIDFEEWDVADEGQLDPLVGKAHRKSFDLEHRPPARFRLISLPAGRKILVITLHHLICDGWSMEIIRRDLTLLAKGENLPPAERTYDDFCREQAEFLVGQVGRQRLDYWRACLSPPPPPLQLPVDSARGDLHNALGRIFPIHLKDSLVLGLRKRAAAEHLTLQNLLLGMYAIFLNRLTGQTDMVIGCPTAGREDVSYAEVVGYFVEPVPVRIRIEPQETLSDSLCRIREAMAAAMENGGIPFASIVGAVGVTRDPTRSPIFDVSFNHARTVKAGDDCLPSIPIEQAAGKFDLTLNAEETAENRLSLFFGYRADLFHESSIKDFADRFVEILKEAVQSGEDSRRDAPGNRESILEGSQCDAATLLTDRVIESGRLFPGSPAVFDGETALTYAEFLSVCHGIIGDLQDRGCAPGQAVGVWASRKCETVAAMMGVMMAGCVAVPLDPEWPRKRFGDILRRAGIQTVFSSSEIRLEMEGLAVLPVPDPVESFDLETLQVAHSPSAGYLLFTSGSTGVPKGVMVGLDSLSNYAHGIVSVLKAKPGDCFGHLSPLTTDLGHTSWVGALYSGGCLCLIPDSARLDSKEFQTFVAKHPVDHLKATPSHFAALCGGIADPKPEAFPLKSLILGGERVNPDWIGVIKRAASSCRLVHHYGPTEATVGVLTAVFESDSSEKRAYLPLRDVVPNTRIRVVDAEGRVVPHGTAGELVIDGRALARGYLAELPPKSSFPGWVDWGSSGYRTGDQARISAAGEIELLGRLDRQVKVRGIRIEPGEVESVLREYPPVNDCRVFASEDQLVAFLVSDTGEVALKQLKQFVSERLPTGLVPSRWISAKELPLSANGKFDEDAALSRESYVDGKPDEGRDLLEARMLDLWREVLGRKRVSPAENFFEMGGHSLLAVRLTAGIRETFGASIPLSALLKHPTVEDLCQMIRRQEETANRNPVVRMNGEKDGGTHLLIPGAGGSLISLRSFALGIETGKVLGLSGEPQEHPPSTVEDAAARLRAAIGEQRLLGPVHLAGHSFGALVAWELAAMLEADGVEVVNVGLIDNPASPAAGRRDSESWSHADWLHHIGIRMGKLFGKPVGMDYETLRHMNPDQADEEFVRLLLSSGLLPTGTDPAGFSAFVRLYKTHAIAASRYVPTRNTRGRFKTFVFRASQHDPDLDLDESSESDAMGWMDLAPAGVSLFNLPGTHLTLLMKPQVDELIRIWNRVTR